jgi:hypothetical protein
MNERNPGEREGNASGGDRPQFEVYPRETAAVVTLDGTRLDADIYRPAGDGPFPVLLMRQPYGRAIASTVVYAHPSWYAAHGYIVVIQDVRGRGTSTGEFDLFAHEEADGWETVNWAASLPGSTGTVGMYGFSYQGMTQLYAAASHPPALKVLCPAMVGPDLYADWAYEGGAFCLQANLAWAIQLAAETVRRRGEASAYQRLYQASRSLPVYDAIPADPEILRMLAPESFYHDWIHHPDPGEYWRRRSPDLSSVDLPMLHIGGWFDPYLRGTLSLYHLMREKQQLQHLWVGPWGHLPWSRHLANQDFGEEAISPIDRVQIAWFDYFLKGLDREFVHQPAVKVFELGSNQWRSLPEWPQGKMETLFLVSNGLACIRTDAGQLGDRLSNRDSGFAVVDTLVHDPWRPVPSVGGHAGLPSGPCDRTAVEERSDVLTYTSKPLTTDLYLAGTIQVEVWCRVDAPSFDWCAVLSEVHADGRSLHLSQGYLRVRSNQPSQDPQRITLSLQPICACIKAGYALRLSLSAACFPAYTVNPGTGTSPEQTSLIEARIITLQVWSGEKTPSCLRLAVNQFA